VFVPPGYGQDVKSWSTAPPGTTDVTKDAPKVTFNKMFPEKHPEHALFTVQLLIFIVYWLTNNHACSSLQRVI